MSSRIEGEPVGTTHVDSGHGGHRFLKQVGRVYLLWNGERWTHPVAPRENVKSIGEVKVTGMPNGGEEPVSNSDFADFNELSVARQPGDTLYELWRCCWGESGMKRVEKTVFVGREYGKDFEEAVRRHIKKIGEVDMYCEYGGWYDTFHPSKDAAPDDFMPELVKDRADKYEVAYE